MSNNIRRIILYLILVLEISSLFLCIPSVQNFILHIGGMLVGKVSLPRSTWGIRIISFALFIQCALISIVLWSRNTKLNRYGLIIGLLFIVGITGYINFTSFPLNFREVPFTDSAVFTYIGKMMHLGYVPYKHFFDHKGIYLYFFQFLGTMTESGFFLFVLEFFCLFFAAFYMYKIGRLITDNQYVLLISVLISLLGIGLNFFEGGNFTESYALPFLAFSLYIFLKFIKQRECTLIECMGSGISFVIVILLRVNMVSLWVFYLPIIFIILLKEQKFRQLGELSIAFIIGMVLAFIPVLIYLNFTDSVGDMWNSYIIFNLKYKESALSEVIESFAYFFILLFFLLPFIMYTAIKYYKEKLVAVNMLSFLLGLYFVVSPGNKYAHYAIVLVPYFMIPVVFTIQSLVFWLKNKGISNLSFNRKFNIGIGLMFILALGLCILSLSRLSDKKVSDSDIVKFLINNTQENDDILVLGNNVRYNLLSNRCTKQRFFYQVPILGIDESMHEEFLQNLEGSNPDYIVCPEAGLVKILQLESFLTNYKEIPLSNGAIYMLKNREIMFYGCSL